MTDLEYVYNKDIRERKQAGRGIFSKKNGSKSKKCTLPSDNMTKKERNAMNSEVKNYDLKKFYRWEDFLDMPEDIQLQYINSIINRYNVGIATISDVVFSKSASTLNSHLVKHDLLKYVNTHGRRGGSKTNRLKLYEDVKASREGPKEIQNGSEKPVETEKKDSRNVSTIMIRVDKLDIDLLMMIEDLFVGKEVEYELRVIPK